MPACFSITQVAESLRPLERGARTKDRVVDYGLSSSTNKPSGARESDSEYEEDEEGGAQRSDEDEDEEDDEEDDEYDTEGRKKVSARGELLWVVHVGVRELLDVPGASCR